MTLKHLYFGIENLAMNDTQRDIFVDALRALGRKDGGAAHERMQFRVRADRQAALFEATFDDADLTIQLWKNRLASLFGVSANTITNATNQPDFGAGTTTVVTFGRAGTDYLRVALFGGVNATTEQSRVEAVAYLALHTTNWDGV